MAGAPARTASRRIGIVADDLAAGALAGMLLAVIWRFVGA